MSVVESKICMDYNQFIDHALNLCTTNWEYINSEASILVPKYFLFAFVKS